MKVYQINICPDLSTGTLMQNISNELYKEGHTCEVATAPKKGYFGNSKHYIIGSMLERHIHIVLGQIVGSEIFFSNIATWKLIRHIKKYRPDIIHLHNIHQFYLNYTQLFRFLNKEEIPIVWTFHDCWPFTGGCHHYEEEQCFKWKSKCEKCIYREKANYKPILDLSLWEYKIKRKFANQINKLYIVTPSKWLKSEVQKSFYHSNIINVIYNGVDINEFKFKKSKKKEEYNLKDKFIILGVASHWSKNKGMDDFVSLADELGEEYQIVLIGVDSNTKLKSRKNILYLDRTSDLGELVEWYSCADVYCNLSTEESFGMVVVEAMACGTPVIVYNTTASPELLEGTECYVCEKHDINQVIRSIKEIEITGKEKYSKKCVDRVLKEFNKNTVANKYIELYKKIIKKSI